VQGQGSAAEIASALQRLDASGECDVIIVGRGGGSLEDLWSFNDESLARVIAKCQTPIVSAVGHETDFTIADFVADIRAATPTHAATTVVPKAEDVLNLITHQRARIDNATRSRLKQGTLAVERLTRRLGDPRMAVLRAAQRVDDLLSKARSLMQRRRLKQVELTEHFRRRLEAASPMSRVGALSRRFKALRQRFSLWQPSSKIGQGRNRLERYQMRLHERMRALVLKKRENLRRDVAALSALSPLAVMGRGYSITFKGEHVVTSVAQVEQGDHIKIRVRDGEITTIVKDKKNG
jgi:exodeoxyribonuclease VII large subunit